MGIANCELMAWVIQCGFGGHDWLLVFHLILYLVQESKFQSQKDFWELQIANA
jgi:hypothetical protein